MYHYRSYFPDEKNGTQMNQFAQGLLATLCSGWAEAVLFNYCAV